MLAKRLVGLTIALAMMAGCAEISGRADSAGADAAGQLDARRVVLVAMPRDNAEVTLGPEQFVALRMAVGFARHAKRVDMAPGTVQDLDVMLRVARKDRAGYLALPVVSNWDERTGSLAPDRASIGIAVFDVSSGQLIASGPLERKTRPFLNFVSAGAQSPSQHLIDAYLDKLY